VKRLVLVLVLVLAAASVVTACSTPSRDALRQSLDPLPRGAASTTTALTTGPPTTTAPSTMCDPQQSFAPQPGAPTPSLDAIRQRGYLVVGVDQGTRGWGFRNPANAQLTGLEVELLRRIAREIFQDGDPKRVVFKTLNTAQRITAVEQGKVDLVASLLTATCDRWQEVDFSTVYFLAHQALLVDNASPITSVADLAGRRVCATRGSTSIAHIAEIAPKAILVPVEARSDCIVALQEGDVDAITSDDTILRSFQAQDNVPLTRLVALPPGDAEEEPYAIAIAQNHVDLVRFVNGVLEEMRQDGSLQGLYPDKEGDAPVPAARYR
jgi:polar amino acid transport system substrate-binding protein